MGYFGTAEEIKKTKSKKSIKFFELKFTLIVILIYIFMFVVETMRLVKIFK